MFAPTVAPQKLPANKIAKVVLVEKIVGDTAKTGNCATGKLNLKEIIRWKNEKLKKKAVYSPRHVYWCPAAA